MVDLYYIKFGLTKHLSQKTDYLNWEKNKKQDASALCFYEKDFKYKDIE